MEAKAVLKNTKGSARKARMVTDLIRGKEVNQAYTILEHTNRAYAEPIKKLLLSAIKNWEVRNELRADNHELYIKEIYADGARTLKRFQPAPFGRAYRIRKRYAHISIVIDSTEELENDELIEDEIIDEDFEENNETVEENSGEEE